MKVLEQKYTLSNGVGIPKLGLGTWMISDHDVVQAVKLKAIGVSNFEKQDLDNLLDSCSVKPMVNQILAHISNTP